jgi:type 1 glutamine amidotransferase
MQRILLYVTSLIVVSSCVQFAGSGLHGAEPPGPRSRQEIEAVLAQAPAPAASSELRQLRIVLLANRKDHGLHEHDYPLWMERWKVLLGGGEAGASNVNLYLPAADSRQGPQPGAANVVVQTAMDWPSPAQWADADLVVAFMGTGGIWNAARLGDLRALLDRGGGFVSVHSAIIAEQPTARPLAELTGLAWESGYTLFRHGPVNLKIVGRQHAICKGLPEQIHFEDETYWPLVGDSSRVAVLATAEEQDRQTGQRRDQPMFWAHNRGKGRVYGCILGHYTWTFDDPYFRILLLRGMAWAANESPYRFDPLVLRGISGS